jgi:rubredoxin
MDAYICSVCGFLYDDESAEVGPDGKLIPFTELDFEWTCPNCGLKGTLFERTYSTRTTDLPTETEEEEKKK